MAERTKHRETYTPYHPDTTGSLHDIGCAVWERTPHTVRRLDSRELANLEKRIVGARKMEGFTPQQEEWVRSTTNMIGLPLDNVTRFAYEPNHPEKSNWLGSMNYGTGEVTLYKRLGESDIAKDGSLGTLVHELAHACDPFEESNDEIYGSAEARNEAKMHVYSVAEQTDITDIALNGYHASLLKEFRSGDITIGRFLRETHAIMTQLRMTNPDRLTEVQNKQKDTLQKLQEQKNRREVKIEFTELTADNDAVEAVGVDKIIMALTGDRTLNKLNQRVSGLTTHAINQANPFKNTDPKPRG